MPNRDLQLLSELASAISTVHAFTGTARACAEVLHRHLPLRWFELARRDATQGIYHAILCTVRADEVMPEQVQRTHAETPLGDAHRMAQSLVLPFQTEDEVQGYAAFALVHDRASLSPVLLEALSRVLQVAFRNLQLLERVASLSRRAHVENQMLRSELQKALEPERVAAVSEASRRVLAMADLVAVQDTTVLLRGESGTGKEVLARRIHRLSARANRPFLKINCGALPEGLVESTLFGHERGAFTGAAGRHRGFFERAHGGTLLLDEVAELPLGAQAKLLRILQDGELERVGGESMQRVDVRVLAATHRPIEQMVAAGSFRADLYYRLNIFPITVPPLRDRVEDLPMLVEVLLEKHARRHGRPVPYLTPVLLDTLRRHSWPGNVRELENLIERALILTPPGEQLVLPNEFAVHALSSATRDVPREHAPRPYAQTMRECVEQALAQSRGQVYGPGGAAALLGMPPTTLQSKMKKLGLRREDFVNG